MLLQHNPTIAVICYTSHTVQAYISIHTQITQSVYLFTKAKEKNYSIIAKTQHSITHITQSVPIAYLL